MMKRARKAPDIPLTDLRFAHLVRPPDGIVRLVNLKVPAEVLGRVHAVARRLGVTKSAALVALLNEGLQVARRRGIGAVGGRRLAADAAPARRSGAAR